MAAVASQHIRHLGRHLGFIKNNFSAKMQQIFLKSVENIFI